MVKTMLEVNLAKYKGTVVANSGNMNFDKVKTSEVNMFQQEVEIER